MVGHSCIIWIHFPFFKKSTCEMFYFANFKLTMLAFILMFILLINQQSPVYGTPIPSTSSSIMASSDKNANAVILNATDVDFLQTKQRMKFLNKNLTNSRSSSDDYRLINHPSAKSLTCSDIYDQFGDCGIYMECCHIVCNARNKPFQYVSCEEGKARLLCECSEKSPSLPEYPLDSTVDPQETTPQMPTLKPNIACGRPKTDPSINDASNRVVGGSVTIPHSWPWQVSLRCRFADQENMPVTNSSWGHWCGGTVLDEFHVLTASHCLHNGGFGPLLDKSDLKVVFGLHERQSSHGVSRDIDQFWINPLYNQENTTHDVAVIRLSRPITFSDNIMPVCLPESDVEPGTNCTATGWGVTDIFESSLADKLRQVEVPIISNSDCSKQEEYIDKIDSAMICAGTNGKGVCGGDSGGPLVCQGENGSWEQHGITSWGYMCATSKGGVYTRVTAVLDWIKSKIEL